MSLIIHLVPRLPPAICGLADYSLLVGGKIEQQQPDVQCGYVACGHRLEAEFDDGRGRRNATEACDTTRLWRAVEEVVDELAGGAIDHVSLLLHYSGYGYDRCGAPRWLADALERRPLRFSKTCIATMFHEMYATGWPWQRAFWNSSRQRQVAIRIARLSEVLFTNRDQSARWLERVTGRAVGSIPSLPVPSNVGEPEDVPSWEKRLPRAVTFGGGQIKRFALSTRSHATAKLLATLGITQLIDIGSPVSIDRTAFQACGIRIEQFGICQRDHVSELLLQSRIGLVDYPFDFLSKSGVIAAYSAHGLALLINGDWRSSRRDELFPTYSLDGLAKRPPPTAVDMAFAAQRVRAWYCNHRSSEHARMIMQHCSAVRREDDP